MPSTTEQLYNAYTEQLSIQIGRHIDCLGDQLSLKNGASAVHKITKKFKARQMPRGCTFDKLIRLQRG